MFGYVRGGYSRILNRFADKLSADDVSIQVNQRVTRIDSVADGVRVERAGAVPAYFDRVIVTSAAPLASQLCPSLTTEEHQRLRGITCQGIICASVLLTRPLANYYVTNITDDWVPFTAVIEMSALVDRQQFAGNSLIYLPKYVAPDDPMFRESDEQIEERFLAALEAHVS